MGTIALVIACLFDAFMLVGYILCIISQRKAPGALLPLNGIIGLLFITTIIISAVLGVGSY